MGYSKYELNTINMLYSLKEFVIFLHPYLPITATSPQRPISCPQGGRCGEVRLLSTVFNVFFFFFEFFL